MSQHRGAKGKRLSDIEEEEWYRDYLDELRAEEAALPSYMDYSEEVSQ